MHRAHHAVSKQAVLALRGALTSVVDLGCGNGALARTIADRVAGCEARGIDRSETAIAHAHLLGDSPPGSFVVGDLFRFGTEHWPDDHFALALLMPGRLLEHRSAAAAFVGQLMERCDHVLAYAYGDWIDRFGSIAALAAAVDLHLAARPSRSVAWLAP